MSKRKEIKFRHVGRDIMEGRQDGVIYRIFHPWHCPDGDHTVSITDTKEKGRTINTAGYKSFTYAEAVEFCQQIAAGEINVKDLRTEFEAVNASRERKARQTATETAKKFRDELDKFGLKYSDLLYLEALAHGLGDMGHNILLGYERGEGWPNV